MKKLNFQIVFNLIRPYVSSKEFLVFNNFISSFHYADELKKHIGEISLLLTEPDKVINKYWGWDHDDELGYAGFIGGNEVTGLAYKDGSVFFIDNGNYGYKTISFTIDELIKMYEKVLNLYNLFEKDESFTTYPNLLNLIQKKYHKKITSWGFRLISQFDNAVSYKKDWLILNFLEDQEGPILYLIDERINQRYDFNLALELLDHYASTIHSMLYQKYKLKLSKEEARSGYFVKTMEYLESHLLDKVRGPDETFFRELENERQLRNKMLQKVLTLPHDHPIKQRFLNEDEGWWDEMREMLKNEESK